MTQAGKARVNQPYGDLTTVLFTHYPQQLRGKVHDYVNPLAVQINVSVVCKHED